MAYLDRLKYGFLAMLVACSAYFVRKFGTAHSFFYYISERTQPYVFKFILLLLCVPCFYISNLFFEITYSLQQRKLVRLGRECVRLGGHDESLQFDDCLVKLREIADRPERLGHIEREFKRC